MSEKYETHSHDVIVIGAGGAGLRAAIEASSQGASVALICKSLLGKAHTVMAEGGVAAALANVASEDNWKVHFRDTMRGGKLLNQWQMAQHHAEEAPDRIQELESWGAVFDRTAKGHINQRNFGGHRYPRLAHIGDRTGLEMIRTLQDRGVHQGFEVFMECTIFHLLKDGDRVCGAVGYWRESGKFVVFKAKSIILATGGIGKAFEVTSNSWEYTGDGHSLAFIAGAEMIDMEFVQFHPTGMIWPPSIRGTLVTEAVRGEGGVLRNKDDERFMFKYIPDFFKGDYAETEEEADRWVTGDKSARRPPELLTRDVVARAIRSEAQAGRGSEHGGAYLDIATRRDPEYIKKKLPSMYHQFKELGDVDITKAPMEVGPTTHYVMGGIRVDPDTQESTTVKGLYACGECGGGMHGANRLGGNSLSDLLVFGKRAGEHAAKSAASLNAEFEVSGEQVEKLCKNVLVPFDRASGESPFIVTEDLQTMMQNNAGIVRTEEDLIKARGELVKLKERASQVRVSGNRQFNPGWHQAIDLRNLLIVSDMLVAAALERKESRGAHTRIDFPNSEDDWGKRNVIISQDHGKMSVRIEPLPEMPEELKALF